MPVMPILLSIHHLVLTLSVDRVRTNAPDTLASALAVLSLRVRETIKRKEKESRIKSRPTRCFMYHAERPRHMGALPYYSSNHSSLMPHRYRATPTTPLRLINRAPQARRRWHSYSASASDFCYAAERWDLTGARRLRRLRCQKYQYPRRDSVAHSAVGSVECVCD